jgi:hypothetical protein
MNTAHLLTRHRDIQNWVTGKRGMPAIVPGQGPKARLALRFDRPRRPESMPSTDQGMSPVSWAAWLSEFDRQQLALKVEGDNAFELIARKDLN